MNGSKRKRSSGNFQAQKNQWIPYIGGEQILRSGLFLILIVILTALYPTRRSYEYHAFREGTIASEEVIAPETFKVHKSETEYIKEINTVQNEIPPVLVFQSGTFLEREQTINTLFNDLAYLRKQAVPDSVLYAFKQSHPETGPISESTLRFLVAQILTAPKNIKLIKKTVQNIFTTVYNTGIIDWETYIPEKKPKKITFVRDNKEQKISIEEILDTQTFFLTLQEDINKQLPQGNPARIKTVYELVVAFLKPNLIYDKLETENRRNRAIKNISWVKGTVLKGERIVDKHDRVTSEHIDKLASLNAHMNLLRQEDPSIILIQVGARTTLSALLVAVFFGFLSIFRPIIFNRISNILLFSIIILMPVVVAHYASDLSSLSPFLVPIALSAMLTTVLFDAEIGLVVSLVTSTLCSSILGDLQHSLVFLITGIIGVYSVRQVLHRRDFYRSIVYLSIVYTLTISATGILLFNYTSAFEFFDKVKLDLIFGIFTAGASTVLTIGLLPIFESIFNVVTPISLLELSDLNRPLLRNLAIRTPGTYSHSINMASLSEAAADAIGADRLLVRVGCYYHDIGKMIRPQYFIENQKGINPHDELQPKMSALILISHVKEGIELAEEEGLPKAIIDLIPQHHGTSEIASFKQRALEQNNGQSLRNEDFRYPGPKPQTKEAGIVNLADAVESATRTLSNPSPDQIKGMVQTIIMGRFTTRELDECHLTLRDLTNIKKAFLPILQATRHYRVPYPWQQDQKKILREESRQDKERT